MARDQPSVMPRRILVVQLGHCYRTRGATGTAGHPDGITEQTFATATARQMHALIHGSTDASGTQWLVRRILADDPTSAYIGDAFVAIHADGSIHESARGASVGYRGSSGQALATRWRNAYDDLGWSGFRPDNYTDGLRNYYGVRAARSAGNWRSFILEAGFLTNPDESEILSSERGQLRVAGAMAQALDITPPGEPTPPETDIDTTGEEPDMIIVMHPNGAARLLRGLHSYPINTGEQVKSLRDDDVPLIVCNNVEQFNRYFSQGTINH